MADAAKPFFRADHVGSLLRPPELLEARQKYAAGGISAEELRNREDAAIADAVRLQEGVGLKAVTDGEFRREVWWTDFIGRMPGIRITEPDTASEFKTGDGKGSGYVPKVVETYGQVKHADCLMAYDYSVIAEHATETPKVPIPSPTRIHFHSGRAKVDAATYPDMDRFWADIGAFYRAEIAALEEMGCRNIQIDDPILTYFIDDRMLANLRHIGEDPETLIHTYARVLNDCIGSRRADTHLSVHLCRGNAISSWIVSGGYQKLAEPLFPVLDFDTYFLEYDDDRSGGFEPLAHIPAGKNVVLGLVTSKFGTMETADGLKRRIDEAAKFVDIGNLALSPQCGFASVDVGNKVTLDDQMRKLELVVKTAEDVWGTA